MTKEIKKVLIYNFPLLLWFVLDMTGFYIGENMLVSQAYKEDGLFFIVYLTCLLLFIFAKKDWKISLPICLTFWFSTQMYFHWYFTIFGPWEGKNKYFEDCIKLFPATERYIPDLYHIVLHTLILIALISSIRYFKKTSDKVK